MGATKVFAITLLSLALGGVGVWFLWGQFGPDSTEGTARELAFGNVSITLPSDDSGLLARPDYAPPESVDKPGGGPVIVVTDESEARSGYLVIDANTGEVLVDTIDGALRDEADDVISSVEQQRPDGVWPLADVAPSGPRITFGNMTYIEPDPSSGIFVVPQEWDGDDTSGVALFIHDGESRMLIDGNSGKVEVDLVLPEDREVFDRVAAAVTVEPKP